MANQQVHGATTGDCDAMSFDEGPWQSDGGTSGFRGLQQEPWQRIAAPRAHPVFAPLAWLACLLAGAAFWAAVLKLAF